MFGFKAASLVPTASFHGDMATGLAHPVGGARAMVGLQGGEWPVRVGQHVDAALRADQDGDIGRDGRFRNSFRRFQNRFGVVEKCSHTELIGTRGRVFAKMRLFVVQGVHRVDAGGAAGGQQACQHGDA